MYAIESVAILYLDVLDKLMNIWWRYSLDVEVNYIIVARHHAMSQQLFSSNHRQLSIASTLHINKNSLPEMPACYRPLYGLGLDFEVGPTGRRWSVSICILDFNHILILFFLSLFFSFGFLYLELPIVEVCRPSYAWLTPQLLKFVTQRRS